MAEAGILALPLPKATSGKGIEIWENLGDALQSVINLFTLVRTHLPSIEQFLHFSELGLELIGHEVCILPGAHHMGRDQNDQLGP